MAGFSDYLEAKILNWIKGVAFGTAPTNVYVGLYSAAPTDAGGGTEVTTTIRAAGRVAASFGSVTGNTITSNAVVDFGTAEGGATATHFGIFDAASGGNLLGWAALNSSQTISAGNSVSFASGGLTISAD